ncbi:NUDIX hydrolase [Eubacterium oxidoreducens]|uniref:8-oxo-dGTP diphosphatase n=1 Tax=Eubacterium oxidoreducens TaxID=1732 RepID=A0A1G6A615_EUBOX|nr:8-oxo-dGTP diphosphatase [Eubacterium oxidoreducens]SDB03750.1 8-oxo-dGTP diphosphatase [Eubacterium oxidoreducens]
MRNTTLVYIEQEDCYLMLYRNKKEHDQSHGKWLGVGGKFEENESPVECMMREVLEETGLTVKKYRFRGLVTFVSDLYETEYMHLFTVSEYSGQLKECNEGELRWIPKSQIMDLNLWDGDREFFKLLFANEDFFTLKLTYQADKLIAVKHENCESILEGVNGTRDSI